MAADEINTIEKGASEKMEKTIGVLREKLASIRGGRAEP